MRGGYTYIDKSFKQSPKRDAKTHQVSGDAYYFFYSNKGFVRFGGLYEDENTVDPALTYKGYQLNANLQLPMHLWSRTGKLKFGYNYRDRSYDNITPSLAAKRNEQRSTFRAGMELPLTDELSFAPEYRYVDRASNFAISNYTENVASGTLSYRF